MCSVHEGHFKTQTTTRLVSEIVFNPEFSNLYEELSTIYRKAQVAKPEQEAFYDALYSFLSQKDQRLKAVST